MKLLNGRDLYAAIALIATSIVIWGGILFLFIKVRTSFLKHSGMSAYDPKRTLKFNLENKNGAALKPRQVVMRKR